MVPHVYFVFQLLPADNIAVKVRELAHNNNTVDWMALGTFAAVALGGLSTFFVRDLLKVVRAISLISAAAAVFNVSGSHTTHPRSATHL